MARYIDIKLLEEINEITDDNFEWGTYVVKMSDVYKLPTEDVTPIVRGKWEKHSCYNNVLICSNCNRGSNGFDEKYNYCPNCGAKMTEESGGTE